MKVLIAECSPVLRDQLAVGLDCFQAFSVDCADGPDALDRLRRYEYGLVVLGISQGPAASKQLLERIVQEGGDARLMVVAPDALIQDLKKQKLRNRVFTFLREPIDPVDFYRAVHRFLQRRRGARSL